MTILSFKVDPMSNAFHQLASQGKKLALDGIHELKLCHIRRGIGLPSSKS